MWRRRTTRAGVLHKLGDDTRKFGEEAHERDEECSLPSHKWVQHMPNLLLGQFADHKSYYQLATGRQLGRLWENSVRKFQHSSKEIGDDGKI